VQAWARKNKAKGVGDAVEKDGGKQLEASHKQWIKEEIQSERRKAAPPAKTSAAAGAAAAVKPRQSSFAGAAHHGEIRHDELRITLPVPPCPVRLYMYTYLTHTHTHTHTHMYNNSIYTHTQVVINRAFFFFASQ
jgi:hypothetical protein